MTKFDLKSIFSWQNLLNRKFVMLIWITCALFGSLSRYFTGYNNYKIFTGVFDHFTQKLPLYGQIYPAEYFDSNYYGIFFAFLIAPFAAMPDWLGLILWMVLGVWLLYYAVKSLPIDYRWQSAIMLLSFNELFTAIAYQQFNVATAAIIIIAFVSIEKQREGRAAFFIMLATFTKIYGIIGLAFFFFVKRKWRFIGYLAVWAVVMFFTPVIFSSWDYVISQYAEWFSILGAKNADNMFAVFQNISLLGVIRKISANPNYSDLWIIGSGVVLFLLNYLRTNQYKNLGFRLMMLASVLLFVPLFSSGSENCTYIIAIIGVGIWLAITPAKRGIVTWTLIGLVLFASFAGNILPKDIYNNYFQAYALKAVPFSLVWLRICYEMLFLDFSKPKVTPKRVPHDHGSNLQTCEIDVVLPCYNPATDWVETIAEQFGKLCREFPDRKFNLYVTNDGSGRNFDEKYLKKLSSAIPDVVVVDNEINRGKGAALRSGIEQTTSPLIVYTDIDFPYKTQSIVELIEKLSSGEYDIVLATRNETYHNELSTTRRFLSWASRTLNKKVLGMTYSDAQGGLKGFNERGKQVFLKTKVERFLFDTEFIYKASRRKDISMSNIVANLREGIHLPGMGLGVMRTELVNFLRILFNI